MMGNSYFNSSAQTGRWHFGVDWTDCLQEAREWQTRFSDGEAITLEPETHCRWHGRSVLRRARGTLEDK